MIPIRESVGAGAIEFRDEPAAAPTCAEEIGPPAAESARHPKDLCRLFHILPIALVLSDAVAQRELIDGGPENDARPPARHRASIPTRPHTLPLGSYFPLGNYFGR
jgi:hypothetical protein